MKLLEGKRAVITGGSRGLGRALCARYAREGADVAFLYSSDEQGAAATTQDITGHGRRALAFKTSVLDEDGLDALAARLEKEWGGADVLVNNAGISQPLPIALMEGSDWDTVMDVNVKGAFLATRAVARGMVRRKKGVILNIGSLAGERAIESPVHYAASKAALRGFTEALCKEFSRHGIRVNCLAPGLLDEGVGKNLPDHRLEEYVKHVPLGRIGTVEEVAAFAAFLVSDKNAYMNGETILMDGGL
ncbi:MAG: SDR family oxidoreductase [Elusimicrobia bacterium]|nr:SDR family oxidoreductase [Elusimicrobiota bacterium]